MGKKASPLRETTGLGERPLSLARKGANGTTAGTSFLPVTEVGRGWCGSHKRPRLRARSQLVLSTVRQRLSSPFLSLRCCPSVYVLYAWLHRGTITAPGVYLWDAYVCGRRLFWHGLSSGVAFFVNFGFSFTFERHWGQFVTVA